MVWLIRIVGGLCVLVALALVVSFVIAPPKNFGGGLTKPVVAAVGGTGQSQSQSDSQSQPHAPGDGGNLAGNRPLNASNIVPLGATVVHALVGAAQRSYTVRGRIEKLPGEKAGYLMVHHAAISDFLNRKGEVVGMEEMVMEFPAVAPGVTLDGLAVGEPIELTFEVRWDDEQVWVVTRIVELAEGDELGLKAR